MSITADDLINMLREHNRELEKRIEILEKENDDRACDAENILKNVHSLQEKYETCADDEESEKNFYNHGNRIEHLESQFGQVDKLWAEAMQRIEALEPNFKLGDRVISKAVSARDEDEVVTITGVLTPYKFLTSNGCVHYEDELTLSSNEPITLVDRIRKLMGKGETVCCEDLEDILDEHEDNK